MAAGVSVDDNSLRVGRQAKGIEITHLPAAKLQS
jgi:hypothetical protein